MLGLKLNHVSKRGHWKQKIFTDALWTAMLWYVWMIIKTDALSDFQNNPNIFSSRGMKCSTFELSSRDCGHTGNTSIADSLALCGENPPMNGGFHSQNSRSRKGFITATLQWAPWCLKSPAYWLFAQSFIQAQINKTWTSKFRVTGHCEGNSPVTGQ